MLDQLNNLPVPLLGLAGFSGSGKTTLLKQIIKSLHLQGMRIACIKHAHHQFDIDQPQKDSYELRKSGAGQMLIASSKRWALMTEMTIEQEPKLASMVQQLNLKELDLILVEGFKSEAFPKIEIHRPSIGQPMLFANDPQVLAIATDEFNAIPDTCTLPLLDLNKPDSIGEFIQDYCYQYRKKQNG